MNLKKELAQRVHNRINGLYEVFSHYQRPSEGIVTCLDSGPSEKEIVAFSQPLREIPREYINHLEFFGNEWGTLDEIKYLIPRILECYVEDIESEDYLRMDYRIGLHFIRYKLADLDEKKGSIWNEKEADSIRRYLISLYEYLSVQPLKAIDAYLEFMDVLCDVVEDMTPYLVLWQKVPDNLKEKQIEEWLTTHIDPKTLEFAPQSWPVDHTERGIRTERNQIKVKEWVLSEENMLLFVDLFSQDQWSKLSLN